MKVYLVGGAVRDALLGLPVQDRDWVVVGATPEQMLALGYRPVGKDFPVFLHPTSHEEFALARSERKTAPGYHGFVFHTSPEVTLEQDLARRDITINAIAAHAAPTGASGQFDVDFSDLTDPFGGQRDLRQRCLRHVTEAFAEDPVRILRLARLSARLADFTVAPETLHLMRQMVQAGEVDHLVAERVWQELSRGLLQDRPERLFETLRACGALARLLPEVDALWGVPQRADYHPEIDTGVHVMLVLAQAAAMQASLAVRYACLTHDLGKATTPAEVLPRHLGHEQRSVQLLQTLSQRLRVPGDCRALAELVAREHSNVHRSGELDAAATLRLIERCDGLRQPARFAELLLACECDARGRAGLQQQPYPQRPRLLAALQVVLAVKTEPIAAAAQAQGLNGEAIGARVRAARLQALAEVK